MVNGFWNMVLTSLSTSLDQNTDKHLQFPESGAVHIQLYLSNLLFCCSLAAFVQPAAIGRVETNG
jgi:hypothetical protein